jgi:ABC-type Fe3+-hydroxamate transport system substrate-binding protein
VTASGGDRTAATHLVVDDLGWRNELPREPSRVVSLVPNLSELVWWWHRAGRLVGVTDWCTAPPRAFEHARRVRGTKNPDLAAIVELAPDLVLANEEENRELDVARLRDAGVAVHVTRVRALDELGPSLGRLGEALGVPSAGEGTATTIARAIDQVRRVPRPRRAVCAVWRDTPTDAGSAGAGSSGGPSAGGAAAGGAAAGGRAGWWVLGRDTFGADLLAACGFEVVPADPDGRYPVLGLADLRALVPEVVLLPDEPYAFGSTDAEELRAAGLRTRQVDGTGLWWWGPRTPAAVGELSRLARQLGRRRRRAAR